MTPDRNAGTHRHGADNAPTSGELGDLPEEILEEMTFEEELAGLRYTLKLNLYLFIPVLFAFCLYSLIDGRVTTAIALGVLLVSDIFMMLILARRVSQSFELAVYRYVFPGQVILLGVYFLYFVGVRGTIDLYPWVFIFAFLALLVMRRKKGLVTVAVFAVFLAFFAYRSGQTTGHEGLFVRLFLSLGLFSVLHYSTEAARDAYRRKVSETQYALEESAREYHSAA